MDPVTCAGNGRQPIETAGERGYPELMCETKCVCVHWHRSFNSGPDAVRNATEYSLRGCGGFWGFVRYERATGDSES